MKSPRGLCTVALVLLGLFGPRMQAQTSVDGAGSARPFGYDVTEEVTVSGAATALFAKAPKGMLAGSHLLLSTSSGSLDVSVGTFGMGKDARAISAGKSVEVTGVMKTLNDRQVLLARVVKVGDQVYLIRTKQGIVLSPLAREHAANKAAQDGGAL
jgi:hypothetical protein